MKDFFEDRWEDITDFFHDLPLIHPKQVKPVEWVFRSIMLCLLVFFTLVSIQWAAGVFNYYVLDNFLTVDFGKFNAVGKPFLMDDKVLYWLSGWGRDNMFGVMWFAIWSGIEFTLFFLTFTNFSLQLQAVLFFIWFFMWTMVAYPIIRFARQLDGDPHYWVSFGILIAWVCGILLSWLPFVGPFIFFGTLLMMIVTAFDGEINWLNVGLLVWMLVAVVAGIVALGFALAEIADYFTVPLWHNRKDETALAIAKQNQINKNKKRAIERQQRKEARKQKAALKVSQK